MPSTTPRNTADERRTKILDAARWCFLNFGYGKTTFDDIAKRANISRTLLYRSFKNKEEIFTAVFAHWLIARHPAARKAANAKGSAYERLVGVSKEMVLEPWRDMVGAPMAAEFHDVCERLNPASAKQHRRVLLEAITHILHDEESATVFLLALDGLIADEPTPDILEGRIALLARRFAPAKH